MNAAHWRRMLRVKLRGRNDLFPREKDYKIEEVKFNVVSTLHMYNLKLLESRGIRFAEQKEGKGLHVEKFINGSVMNLKPQTRAINPLEHKKLLLHVTMH